MLRIKELRNSKGVSQQKLAEALGVSRSTVAMWETGNSEPDSEMLITIANYFDVSVDYLLGKTEQKNPAAKNDNEIGFDDFTYAMYNESKELSDEKKQQLLEMAKFFKSQLDNENK